MYKEMKIENGKIILPFDIWVKPIDENKEKYEKDRAAAEKEKTKVKERLRKEGK